MNMWTYDWNTRIYWSSQILQVGWGNSMSVWYICVLYQCEALIRNKSWPKQFRECVLKACHSSWYWSKKAWSKLDVDVEEWGLIHPSSCNPGIMKFCWNNLKQTIMQIVVFLQMIDQMININIMSVCKVSALLPALIPEILIQTIQIQLSKALLSPTGPQIHFLS